ncbi:hypothetical protein L4C44_01425 [Vibrio satsumensis]|uniref:hypothetical protein n=1 Tax=Vibrio TaxID=662 RepID=UPI001B3029B5|nr:hypothetical protein [Vibrio crassostreae]
MTNNEKLTLLASLGAALLSLYTWWEDGKGDDTQHAYGIYSDYLKSRNQCLNEQKCAGLDDLAILTAERIFTLANDDAAWLNTITYIHANDPSFFKEIHCNTLNSDFQGFLAEQSLTYTCK